jgi:hypothetical protein
MALSCTLTAVAACRSGYTGDLDKRLGDRGSVRHKRYSTPIDLSLCERGDVGIEIVTGAAQYPQFG